MRVKYPNDVSPSTRVFLHTIYGTATCCRSTASCAFRYCGAHKKTYCRAQTCTAAGCSEHPSWHIHQPPAQHVHVRDLSTGSIVLRQAFMWHPAVKEGRVPVAAKLGGGLQASSPFSAGHAGHAYAKVRRPGTCHGGGRG